MPEVANSENRENPANLENSENRASPAFLRTAAVLQCVTAVTTLGLIFLPRNFRALTDPVAAVERLDDPVFILRLVVGVVHPFLVLAGAAAVATLRMASAGAAAVTGLVFFVMWATVEAVQQAINLVAVHAAWRTTLSTTAEPATIQRLRASIESYAAVSDALFLTILIAFVAANLAFAAAMWSADRLGRAVAIGFVLAAGLGVISAVTSFGGDVLPPSVMAVLYPLIQPPARFLTGVWIWRQAVAGARRET